MLPAAVVDEPGGLQLPGRFGDAFAAHAEHVRHELLRHAELARRKPVETEEQPAAELLVDRVMPIADGRLRHLRDQRLRVAQQQVGGRAVPAEFLEQELAR